MDTKKEKEKKETEIFIIIKIPMLLQWSLQPIY